SPSTDRTLLPESPSEWPTIEPGVEDELQDLSQPVLLNPGSDFWTNLAQQTRLSDPRAAITRVVLSRLARRFALRLSPTALGWQGCGLACWSLGSDDVERAAGALAAIT